MGSFRSMLSFPIVFVAESNGCIKQAQKSHQLLSIRITQNISIFLKF